MKKIKTYNTFINESVKDYLKPKPMEEVIKRMKELNQTPYKKFYKACMYGILPLIQEAIEEGINPALERNVGIRLASEKKHYDVVKYLLTFDRVRRNLTDKQLEKYTKEVEEYEKNK